MALETRSGFHPDQAQFGAHVRSDIAAKPSLIIAKKIAAHANENAPFAPKKRGDKRRRHLKGSYVGRRDGNLRVGKHSRGISVVESTVPESVNVEFGTPSQKAQRTLLKAGIEVSIQEFGHYDGKGEL